MMDALPAHAIKALRASVMLSNDIIGLMDVNARGRLSRANLESSRREMRQRIAAVEAFVGACEAAVAEAEAKEKERDAARERRLAYLREDRDRDDV